MILDSKSVSAVSEMDELELNNLALETAVYVAESWTDVVVGISQDEFKSYIESGEVQSLNESTVEKVKNWVKKVWEKVKAFFSKLVAKVRGWLSNSKSFYEKYKKEIEGGASLVKEFKGYKYTGLDTAGDSVKKAVDTVITKKDYKDEKAVEDTIKGLRKAIADVEEAGDFNKAFVKKLRGSDSKETITVAATDLKALLFGDIVIKNATNQLQRNELIFKNIERNIDVAKPEGENKEYARQLQAVRAAVGIVTSCNSTIVSVMNERLSMYKAYASAAVQAFKKSEAKNEAAEETEQGSSWQEYLKEQGIEF